MRKFGKCVLTAFCFLAGYSLIVHGMDLMNRPSDLALYAGMAMAAGTFLAWPFVVLGIWRGFSDAK